MNREELVAEMRSLVSKDGEFTSEESTRFDECRNALEALNTATETTEVPDASADTEVEETRASVPTSFQIKENMENRNFSIGGVLADLVNGKQAEGFAAEVMQESRNRAASAGVHTTGDITFDPSVIAEMRAAGDFQADSAVSGEAAGSTVGTDIASAIYTLRPKSIFDRLGVTRLTGLRGDLNLPVGAAAVAATATEVGAANQAASSFAANTLTPTRIAAMLTVSGQLMKQSDVNIDAFLMGDLMRAVGQAQDEYFTAALYGALTATDGTDVTLPNVLAEMEADLNASGARRENAEIVMSADVAKLFRTSPMVTNVNAIADANGIIGYNNVISSLATDSTDGDFIVMGDFSDFVIGEWGGLDLKVDTNTLAHQDQVRLIANTHVDATLRQTGNYSAYYNVGEVTP